MRYFEKLRHEFIGKFLKENGHINRSDLCDEFGISIPQASNDLKKWMKKNPGIIGYNTRKKIYEALND